jgi:hypothetical protein
LISFYSLPAIHRTAGREISWEKTDKVEANREYLGL